MAYVRLSRRCEFLFERNRLGISVSAGDAHCYPRRGGEPRSDPAGTLRQYVSQAKLELKTMVSSVDVVTPSWNVDSSLETARSYV